MYKNNIDQNYWTINYYTVITIIMTDNGIQNDQRGEIWKKQERGLYRSQNTVKSTSSSYLRCTRNLRFTPPQIILWKNQKKLHRSIDSLRTVWEWVEFVCLLLIVLRTPESMKQRLSNGCIWESSSLLYNNSWWYNNKQ